MPPLPGEERLLTVFADIHYFFVAPTPRPLHHRFDKGSYFYVYENPAQRTSRLEVANNPGTPDQDAFSGYLDSVYLKYSYKHPCLLTITVALQDQSPVGPSPSPRADNREWRLPSTDPRDEGKYLFRLHTLDVYFWTVEDATLVLDTAKRLLAHNQLEILDAPVSPSREDAISPVVTQLENVVVSDPAYSNGKTRNSRAQSQTIPPPANAPPPAQVSGPGSPHRKEEQTDFTPMAYNPAAPAAPEPIKHREKTPPPLDAAEGTGLAAAALADHGHAPNLAQPYTGVPSPGQAPYFSGPPSQAVPYGSPPQQPGLQHTPSVSSATSGHRQSVTSTFAPPPTGQTGTPSHHGSQSYASVPQDPTAHLYGSSSPPVQSPGAQLYGQFGSSPHQPLQHLQPQYADYLQSRPQPPPGGYAQYSYEQQPSQTIAGNQYGIHSQVYRPTEAEAKSHTKPSKGGQKPGKLEEQAARVDKGVNRLFKKLEKKVG